MNNWKNIIQKAQAKRYVLPSGWDRLSDVAAQFECSEDHTRKELNLLVKAGLIEMKAFAVFDEATRRIIRVTACRKVEVKAKS